MTREQLLDEAVRRKTTTFGRQWFLSFEKAWMAPEAVCFMAQQIREEYHKLVDDEETVLRANIVAARVEATPEKNVQPTMAYLMIGTGR